MFKEELKNIIVEDFQSMLRPLNLMQNIFFCAKYRIRNNFITKNSYCYKYLPILLCLAYITYLACLIYSFIYLLHFDVLFLSIALSIFYQFFSCFLGYLLNIISNTIHKKNNILLVLKIQDVYTRLKINRKDIKYLVIFNWAAVVTLNVLYIIEKTDFDPEITIYRVINVLFTYTNVLFELNVVYTVFFVKLLRKVLNVWVEETKTPRSEDLQSVCHWNSMFKVYTNILEAYQLFQETFRLLVRTFTYYIF